jgi:hypothetical protein
VRGLARTRWLLVTGAITGAAIVGVAAACDMGGSAAVAVEPLAR